MIFNKQHHEQCKDEPEEFWCYCAQCVRMREPTKGKDSMKIRIVLPNGAPHTTDCYKWEIDEHNNLLVHGKWSIERAYAEWVSVGAVEEEITKDALPPAPKGGRDATAPAPPPTRIVDAIKFWSLP